MKPVTKEPAPQQMGKAELEWKADWVHAQWVSQKTLQGWHAPAHHLDPRVVPPRRRDDGTYCTLCNVNMVPYKDLKEDAKDLDRLIVLNGRRCETEWELARAR